jgi:hypothetical protein
MRIKTTDATATTLMLDGATTRLTIPSGKIMFADILISGIKSDGSAAACYKRKVAIKNVAAQRHSSELLKRSAPTSKTTPLPTSRSLLTTRMTLCKSTSRELQQKRGDGWLSSKVSKSLTDHKNARINIS